MGNAGNHKFLTDAVERTTARVGKITVNGRYHRLPKKLSDDYDIDTKVLGSGYNGQVLLATSKVTGNKFAVKSFRLSSASNEKKEELVTECEIFLAMDHPFIARLVDVYEGTGELQLVMECLTGGELFERVQQKKRFSERDAANSTYQMLLAINYIHSHGVVHRDIKLENFLYDAPESDTLKLIDFGFSKIWEPNTRMALSCGTLAYVAPEVLAKSYTSQCDLWSMGVISFILLVGYMPFYGSQQQQIKHIKEGKFLYKEDKWKTVSKDARNFVQSLIVVDPLVRMTASQALEHPFISHRESLTSMGSLDFSTVEAFCQFSQASAFRRACLNVMAWSLNSEQRRSVRQAFIEMDKDNTGVIRLSEFKRVLEDMYHIPDDVAMKAFHALDQHHTDEIHYSEFLAAMCMNKIQMNDQLIKLTFQRFDTDNTGVISTQNLRDVLGEAYDGEKVEQLLKEADLHHDGVITLEEFMSYMRHEDAHEDHLEASEAIIESAIVKGESQRDLAGNFQSQPVLRFKASVRKLEDITVQDLSPSASPVPTEGGLRRGTPKCLNADYHRCVLL